MFRSRMRRNLTLAEVTTSKEIAAVVIEAEAIEEVTVEEAIEEALVEETTVGTLYSWGILASKQTRTL